jgi:hypothetical protein
MCCLRLMSCVVMTVSQESTDKRQCIQLVCPTCGLPILSVESRKHPAGEKFVFALKKIFDIHVARALKKIFDIHVASRL